MSARMCGIGLVMTAVAWALASSAGTAQPPVSSQVQGVVTPVRMPDHFSTALAVHTLVVRGDMTALGPAARDWLTQIDRTPWPAVSAGLVEAMRRSVAEIATATTVDGAAAATGRALGGCGQCHRASGVMPAAPLPASHAVGGIVGHMLDHQRALAHMLEGLVVPSTSQWRQGATALRAAPLREAQLPGGADTEKLRALERQVHALAERADADAAVDGRAAVYGELATTCAACHALHVKVWGPTPR